MVLGWSLVFYFSKTLTLSSVHVGQSIDVLRLGSQERMTQLTSVLSFQLGLRVEGHKLKFTG